MITPLKFMFKYVPKILMFTGLYWVIIFISPFLAAELFGHIPQRGTFLWYLRDVLYYIGLIPAAFTLMRNLIRIFKKDFSWLALIRGAKAKERAAQSPKIAAELLSDEPQGFVFGKKKSSWVRKSPDMDGHTLTIGGAGSGKSSCIAIPSLMSWEKRVFAIDIKGELYGRTRDKRPNIKVFNPLSAKSAGYDPYYLLAKSRNPVQDAREIALAIIPKPPDAKEPFWVESAQNVFTGAILHFHGEGLSFPQTIATVQSTPIETLINAIHESPTQDARYFVNQFVGMEIKTLAGIFSELSNKIMVFATDPDIKACLSKRDNISPEDIERGADIYLQIPEDKIEQWKGLLTLVVNQFLKHFERRPDNADIVPVLFLLDEFARLGKVETVINGLATLRSKKITVCILTQSLAQLDVIYGKEQRQVIADNCQYKAILNATDADTQDYFSRLVGTYDKTKRSKNANSDQFGMGKGTGVGETTEEKRIIKPEEFATLPDIVLLSPFGFFRIDKAPYYKDKAFTSRSSTRQTHENISQNRQQNLSHEFSVIMAFSSFSV